MTEGKLISERSLKNIDRILEIVNQNPGGISFTQLKEELKKSNPKVSDSTIDRALKRMIRDIQIVKFDFKYYPKEGNFVLPVFDVIMKEIENFLNIKADKLQEITKLRVVLSELVGSRGYPAPYSYSEVAHPTDILYIIRLSQEIIEKYQDLSNFKMGLALFIHSHISKQLGTNNQSKNLPREIVRELEVLEKSMFEDVSEKMISTESIPTILNEPWYYIYRTLSVLGSRRINEIFDTLLEKLKKVEANKLDKAIETATSLINNVLWNENFCKMLYYRQAELFANQLKEYPNRPELSLFFQQLRAQSIQRYGNKQAH